MRRHILFVLAAVSLALAGPPVVAQSTSELLEKGIYLEETVGDVDRAIEIYTRIVDETATHRTYVAEALFRLGMCHLKNDDPAEATVAFERVIADYSDQAALVARAREHMPADPADLKILPAPWNDGEVMHLTLKLTSGVPIGTMLMSADSTELDGTELWRLRVRRRIFSDTDNQAISEVLVRRNSMAPLKSVFKHTVVGHFEAEYLDGKAIITTVGPGTTREHKLEQRIFDNESGFHLFRRLPLEVGYKATAYVMTAIAGDPTPIEIEITETEMITVPAGEFECFRMDFNGPQTFWYSTDPAHTLVKFEGSGIIGELDEVFERDPGKALVHRDDERGYTVTTPPNWLFHELQEGTTMTLLLLDPDADSLARVEIQTPQGPDGRCSAAAASLRKRGVAESYLPAYVVRDGSWNEQEIGGRSAVSFIGDYVLDDHEMVHYYTYIESGTICAAFTLKTRADRFDELREVFDTIIQSYDGPRPVVAKAPELSPMEEEVRSVITDFHLAAAQADTERYFGYAAPDLIFLGTDGKERFDRDQLRALAEPYFSQGTGWVATPTEQNVMVAEESGMAWFDERLDSRNFGEMRASGVLRKDDDGWRVVQYHVAFPVPNALALELLEQSAALDGATPPPAFDVDFAPGEPGEDASSAALAVLQDLHFAKAEAAGERYFGHLAPDGIFLGTDRAERFTVAKYRAFVMPYFDRGVKRFSVPLAQHLFLSPDEQVAWFEEHLYRKDLGEMRGTGVLRKVDGKWKLAHYNMVLPVPNELAEEYVDKFRSFYVPQ